MANYEEAEDPSEIERLNRKLSAKLRAGLRFSETRTIGSPGGSSSRRLRFLSDTFDGSLWWCGGLYGSKKAWRNLFGHGKIGNRNSLNIEVQFNFSASGFSRRRGGAFLRDTQTGGVVLAHRGVVALGHAHIPRSAIFDSMPNTVREADTSKGRAKFLLVGELESASLIHDIDAFSSDIRRQAKSLGSVDQGAKAPKSATVTRLLALREYFDEFSGHRQFMGQGKTIADCYHGNVVRALRDALGSSAKVQVLKNRDVDMVLVVGKKAFIFEVKTSANTQSVYTAIGQLAVHSLAVARRVGVSALARVIVLPNQPSENLRRILEDGLKIRILTFSRSAPGRISIEGVHKLK